MFEIIPSSREPLLQGAIDMHIHVHPDTLPRCMDFLDIAKEAREIGMAGLVFKDTNSMTTDRAYAVNKLFSEIKAFAGLALNLSVGGLNPFAVDAAIKLGAKVIWMPTLHTAHSVKMRKRLKWKFLGPSGYPADRALTIVSERGALLPEVVQILESIAKSDILLATGHISPEESLALIREAGKRGVKKILVTHVSSESIDASLEQQKEMVKMGACLEHSFASCMPAFDRLDPQVIAESIRYVKAENCVMSTDFGQVFNPTPVEGLKMFIKHMQKLGIADSDIEKMVKMNPHRLLGVKVQNDRSLSDR